MAPVGSDAAWTAADLAPPLGWSVSGPYRLTRCGSAWPKGRASDDYASGSGQYAEQALRRLSSTSQVTTAEVRPRVGPKRTFLVEHAALAFADECGAY